MYLSCIQAAVHSEKFPATVMGNTEITVVTISFNIQSVCNMLMKICVYYKYTTCFGTYPPSSGVDSTLFIYANILKAMAIGHFSYQPKLMEKQTIFN
jgi:hypothetical protein